MPTFQSVDVTDSTDDHGQFTFQFDNTFDRVLATGSSPGPPTITAVTTDQTGPKEVTVKCFKQDGSALANHQVTVSLVAVSGA